MSKRRAEETTSARKKPRKDDGLLNLSAFGAPSAEDEQIRRGTVTRTGPSGSWSERTLEQRSIPTLATLAARVFTENFRDMFVGDDAGEAMREWFAMLPDHLLLRIWNMLIDKHPSYLSHGFITMNFVRGDTIRFTDRLTGITKHTVLALKKLGSTLVTLEILEQATIPDETFGAVIKHFSSLRHLNLRGCTKASNHTARGISRISKSLVYLNLGSTAVSPPDLGPVLIKATNLQVLKLANIQGFNDQSIQRLVDEVFRQGANPLGNLLSLKLRHTLVSTHSLNVLLPYFPLLQTIDISFVPLRHLPLFSATNDSFPPLQKLSLTSTPINAQDLIAILPNIAPTVRVLNLGAMGASAKNARGHTLGGVGDVGRTLTDAVLRSMTTHLMTSSSLESVNLAGNTLLGMSSTRSDSAIAYFIHHVGRNLISLNLGGIPHIRSNDLEGLVFDPTAANENYGETKLTSLVLLNATKLNDEAAVYIAGCKKLKVLDLENTKFSQAAIFDIISACPELERLNLTSVRSIRVQERRRIFEVWAHPDSDSESISTESE